MNSECSTLDTRLAASNYIASLQHQQQLANRLCIAVREEYEWIVHYAYHPNLQGALCSTMKVLNCSDISLIVRSSRAEILNQLFSEKTPSILNKPVTFTEVTSKPVRKSRQGKASKEKQRVKFLLKRQQQQAKVTQTEFLSQSSSSEVNSAAVEQTESLSQSSSSEIKTACDSESKTPVDVFQTMKNNNNVEWFSDKILEIPTSTVLIQQKIYRGKHHHQNSLRRDTHSVFPLLVYACPNSGKSTLINKLKDYSIGDTDNIFHEEKFCKVWFTNMPKLIPAGHVSLAVIPTRTTFKKRCEQRGLIVGDSWYDDLVRYSQAANMVVYSDAYLGDIPEIVNVITFGVSTI